MNTMASSKYEMALTGSVQRTEPFLSILLREQILTDLAFHSAEPGAVLQYFHQHLCLVCLHQCGQ